ncbi:YcjX family protein [Thalassotalea mangrovi]|uniref:YcjX family protein n=1 Tax=Thalassotalea mangrovi TaxID=2572245 RepID=A0A4U1B3Z1_9GAMM|nr:YcjX family protein [Thalassotalea mangrovi]TKB44690.1 YcjX family protein [Thalassotalea mangrovi]
MAIINRKKIARWKHKLQLGASDLVNRGLDQHINLAVTGLSQSGKTAFITSLVNQLVNEGHGKPLNFFNAVHEGRFIAAKRVPQPNLQISRFDYDAAMARLGEQEPVWPEPTRSISQIRLAIRYTPQDSLLKYASQMSTLYLDITDYPGEWLLDLSMLEQNYQQWSEYMAQLLSSEPRHTHARDFLQTLEELDPLSAMDENRLAELSQQYTELLLTFRNDLGLSVVQPGRFILPGELEGAPVLQFVPYPFFDRLTAQDYNAADERSFIGMCRARYEEYQSAIVRKFYKQHFVNFDRQIILADCLTPLTNGPEAFNDLQQAIALIMESFSYGNSNLLTRLFAPKIDRILFAATKADHVTSDQHQNLTTLLEQVIIKAKKQLSFDAIKMKTLSIASIQCTEQGKSDYQGKQLPVLKGKRLDNHKIITLYPGSVPAKLPQPSFFKQNNFDYIQFKPMHAADEHQALANIRMDQVLQFLLGDKLK